MDAESTLAWCSRYMDGFGTEATRRFLAGPNSGRWSSHPDDTLMPGRIAPAALERGQPWDALDLTVVAVRVTTGLAWRWIGGRYFLATRRTSRSPDEIGLPTSSGRPFSGKPYADPARDAAARLAGRPAGTGHSLIPGNEVGRSISAIAREWGVSSDLDGATVGAAAARHYSAGDLASVGERDGREYFRVGPSSHRPITTAAVADLFRGLIGREVVEEVVVERVEADAVHVMENSLPRVIPLGDLLQGVSNELSARLHRLIPGVDPDAPTDLAVLASIRVEQAPLRRHLIGRHRLLPCAICTREFPVELLVAAHIKRRAACSDFERRDPNVAMLACKFGCDDMFELGQIAVDSTGLIVPGAAQLVDEGHPARYVAILSGRRCPAHSSATEGYFAWHRRHVAGL